MNIHLILQMAADAMGHREAIVNGDMRVTFEELAIKVRKLANEINDDEKLAFLGEHHPLFPASLFAAALAGTQFVPLNYRLAADQLDKLLKRTAPALLITGREMTVEGIRNMPINSEAKVLFDSEAPDIDGNAGYRGQYRGGAIYKRHNRRAKICRTET